MSNADELFEMVAKGEITASEAKIRMDEIKNSGKKEITYKIGPKGGLCFYGLRKLPISLYREELDQIVTIANTPAFKKFIKDNESKLSSKETK